MKLLILRGANVEGIFESVNKYKRLGGWELPTGEAVELLKNWKLLLPEFTRYSKTNRIYPTIFKKWGFNFILCCVRKRVFPKDIIYLLLEYVARAWRNH